MEWSDGLYAVGLHKYSKRGFYYCNFYQCRLWKVVKIHDLAYRSPGSLSFWGESFFIKDFQTLLPFYFLIKPFILPFEMPKND
jgi:hypothetical protein